MWALVKPITGITNTVIIPTDGMITVSKPDNIEVVAYVDDKLTTPVDSFWGPVGKPVYFEIKSAPEVAGTVTIRYGDTVSTIEVPMTMGSLGTILNESAVSTNIMDDTTMTPTETLNLFGTMGGGQGSGNAMGTGLGAGLVGGLLGTALFGRNGLGGLNGDGAAGAAAVSANNDMAIMQTLGDIKASVPLAESQVQLALAGAQMDLNSSIQAGTGSVIGSISGFQSTVMNNLNMQTLMNAKGFADNQAATVATGNVNLLATKDAATQALQSSWLLNQAITSDGDKTRALIQSIDKTNDSRLITSLANEVAELRNEGRLNTVQGNITISNTNTANAVAQQQQAQQQQQQLAVLGANIAALYQQNQHIQQGVLNIGSGTVSGNSQTAANTRVS